MKDDEKKAKGYVRCIYWLIIISLIVLTYSEWTANGSTAICIIPISVFYSCVGFAIWKLIESKMND